MGLASPRRAHNAALPSDGGAVAVEFALLFPLFLVICFGTISGGILFSDKLALTQGAREAARYGATLPYNGVPADVLDEVLDAADAADYGGLGTGSVSYCASLLTASAGTSRMTMVDGTKSAVASGACPGTGGAGNPLPTHPHVLVTVRQPAELNMLLYSFDLTVGSTSVARFEGTS